MTTDNYQKHTHKNPIQRFLLFIFYKSLFSKLRNIKPKKVLDVGCGEGFTLDRLQKENIGEKLEGIEYLDQAIALGRKYHPDITIKKGTIYKLPYKENTFDMVLCTEVLEHLDDPEKALQELVRVTQKYCLLSVPNEPFFMLAQFMRGKNWSRWGNDIEHINHWSAFGFQKFVSKYLSVQSMSVPFFWTIILAKKR